MHDRTIPFYNTIMKCSDYTYSSVELPDGSWKGNTAVSFVGI